MTSHPVSRRRFIGQISALSALTLALPRRVWAAEPPQKKLGVALVGLGSYSTHQLGPALRESKLCRLTGVVTGDAAKGRRWARDYGFPEKNIYHYHTMARLADNPDIDIVYVVTPNGLHAEHAVAAAKAGKHVICEKPMANSVADCDVIIAACKAAKVRLQIGYRLHYEPHNIEFMRIAREKEFGPLLRMKGENGFRVDDSATPETFWRINAKLAGGGPLMDMGVYVIQAACMAQEEAVPVAVTAKFGPVERPKMFSEVEESVRWTMDFANGARADCLATYADSVSRFRAEGDKGWLELGDTAFYYGGQIVKTSTGKRRFPAVNHQAVQFDGMAAEILSGQPSRVPGEMGRRDVAVVEAIYASARAGGKRVEVQV